MYPSSIPLSVGVCHLIPQGRTLEESLSGRQSTHQMQFEMHTIGTPSCPLSKYTFGRQWVGVLRQNISIILSHQRTVLEAHHLDAILSITQVSFDIEELESSNRMYPSSIHHSQYEFAISSSHRAERWKQASSGTCKC